jgi:hypothetical protein
MSGGSWQEIGIAAKMSATWRFIRKVNFSYCSAKNKHTNCRWRGYNYVLLIINMFSSEQLYLLEHNGL